ncbi:MAG: thiamine pyrophosphate-binding protein [Chloroflexi bacterium]|nr:thiamine pyrophosphate-binding protein [Chloroflexota bacterium]
MGRLTGEKAVGTGGELLVKQARAAGVRYLFTNPGSAEAAFFDALVDCPEIQLIMGLHEGVVISMADGYFKASGESPFVNVHTIAGTGQMAGQLYNANRDGTPMVVTAGLRDNEQYGDLVGLAASPGFSQKDVNRQFTKMSWEIRNPFAIPLAVRRAFKLAATAPTAPVYLAVADYALETQNVEGMIYPRDQFTIENNAHPDPAAINTLAEILLNCRQPVLFVGDEVWRSHAQADVLELAEWLGAAVTIGSDTHRNFPTHHPYFFGASRGGGLPENADVFVALGGKTTSGHESRMETVRSARHEDLSTCTAARRAETDAALKKVFNQSPIHPLRVSHELQQTLEPGTIFLNEQFTADLSPISFGYRASHNEKIWMGTAGASLGWGLGAAIGAKIAQPSVPVVLNIGDGSVMYSASAFWSMARYSVPVLTIVWNNYNYQTVRNAFYRLKGSAAREEKYPGMFLGDPEIDFATLAKSQGVSGERVTEPDGIAAAVRRGLDATRRGEPYVVEIVISRVGGGADSTWHQKFQVAIQQANS